MIASTNNANPRRRLGVLQNVSFATKQVWIAALSGGVTALATALVSLAIEPNYLSTTQRGYIAGAAGFTSFITTLSLGSITAKSVQRSTDNLQAQLEALSQGDFQVRATVYSQDELGQLAYNFNQMVSYLDSTTSEVPQALPKLEAAEDDLQPQLISLLHDILKVARGDLTVQTEVSIGDWSSLADAFNLTIQNLREVVLQVKSTALQFQELTDSETFARTKVSDANRQVEALATALDSLPKMSNALQGVTPLTREVAELIEAASVSLQEGSEALEQTVTKIQTFRELEEQTSQHIRRLGQGGCHDFFKLLELGYQIASQVNQLAQRFSAQIARAGVVGQRFAMIEGELHQLADDSFKTLKYIETLVMQAQSAIGSMITQAEEQTDHISEITPAAQAQQALAEITQANNRIDHLMQAIADNMSGVDPDEATGTITQVMGKARQTAIETSQEAQQVESTLKNLREVTQDLLSDLERYRVEN